LAGSVPADAGEVLLCAVRAACSPGWSPLAPARWLAEWAGPDPVPVRTALDLLRAQSPHHQAAKWRTRAIATLSVALADLETRGAGPEGAVGTATRPDVATARPQPG
jgi:hypothetical protein